MKAAKVESSPRLQRVLAVLKDCRPHTTLDIIAYARVCAVNSCVAELRENGYDIDCTRKGDIWHYQLRPSTAWLAILRRRVEATSGAQVARELGVSRSTISMVLNGTYPASTKGVEAMVNQTYGGEA